MAIGKAPPKPIPTLDQGFKDQLDYAGRNKGSIGIEGLGE